MTDKKSIPSLASLRQNGPSTNNLTQLKEKMQNNKTPSLASLASNSKKPLTSLQTLATRKTTPPLSSLAPKITPTKPSSTSNMKLTNLVNTTKPKTMPTVIPTTTTNEPKEEEEVQDPLIGKPSQVAQFLFKPQENKFDAQAVFQQAIQKPSSIHVFKFDQPSPDDVVLAAQNQRGGMK